MQLFFNGQGRHWSKKKTMESDALNPNIHNLQKKKKQARSLPMSHIVNYNYRVER